MDLVEEIHKLTKKFPSDERYQLVSQLRRASKSIVANIAEGFSRATHPDKSHKYTIARGETTEVQGHLLVAVRIKILKPDEATKAIDLAVEIGKMLTGLIRTYTKSTFIKPS